MRHTRLNNTQQKQTAADRFAFYEAMLLFSTFNSSLREKKIGTKLFSKHLSNFRPLCLLFVTIFLICLAPFPTYQSILGYSLLIVGMVTVGLPHGAVDHLINAKGLSRKITNEFILIYLGLIALMVALWYFLPNITLITFLLFSAFHFGQTDIKSWGLQKNTSFLWGLFLIIFILGTHRNETNEILSTISSLTLPIDISPLFIAPWLVYALINKKKNMFISLTWILLTYQLPLILAFGIYFIGQHSIISWNQLCSHLELKGSAVWMKSLPFQLGAWAILVIFIFMDHQSLAFNPINEMSTSSTWGIFFGFISCISMPHAVYMHKLNTKSK